ncbi:hypothetical protein INT47_000694 [Mucor saturninus]|uniref:RBR-type E3 ubiquitin transferase n=1 Tax=Mucor saturninus TaxID=64648 RepID=A0A8H7RKI3_9FUNG|nr:hypothetical protein INT47_000694 [Mucor saturninus]
MTLPQKRPLVAEQKSVAPVFEANPSSISLAYTDTASITCLNRRSPFECVICLGTFKINIPHGTDGCHHKLCRACIRHYFTDVLKNKHYETFDRVKCPTLGCKETFITDKVLINFYTKAEIKRWWSSAITNAYMDNKIQCPMPGCVAMFDVHDSLTRQCTPVECYECHRGFCVACQSPWHPGEIKVFDDEAEVIKTLKKAEKNSWCRCPNCSRIVEKMSGCYTIKCICGTLL